MACMLFIYPWHIYNYMGIVNKCHIPSYPGWCWYIYIYMACMLYIYMAYLWLYHCIYSIYRVIEVNINTCHIPSSPGWCWYIYTPPSSYKNRSTISPSYPHSIPYHEKSLSLFIESMYIYVYIYIYIWVNYNISLAWIVRPFGDDFPPKPWFQWGRTVRSWWNLPRYIYIDRYIHIYSHYKQHNIPRYS